MGAFIVKQPNGLYCRFSTVVDCPTDYNMTEEEYIELCAEKGREDARHTLDRYVRPYSWVKEYFRPYNMTEEEFEKVCESMETPVVEELQTFPDIHIFIPSVRQIIRISEGDGMNLLDEDIQAGFVDYIYYDQYDLDDQFTQVDGGQVMLEKPFRELFKSAEESIPRVMDLAYEAQLPYIILK